MIEEKLDNMSRDRVPKKKAELVNATYRLLLKNSPNKITIRMIATEADCTSTVIYRHFENLDHLITIASVKLLEDYIIAVSSLGNSTENSLDVLIDMWKEFSDVAFKHAEIFDMLFFGPYESRLNDAIVEYYQMFPSEHWSVNGIFTMVFFSSDIEERNLIMVRRAAADGFFPSKDVATISELQVSLFRGELLKHRDSHDSSETDEKAAAAFMDLLIYLIDATRLH